MRPPRGSVAGPRGGLTAEHSRHEEAGIPVNVLDLTMHQKRIQGSLCGMGSPVREVPLLLGLCARGHLKLDELITRTYDLAEIDQAYEELHAGKNLRGPDHLRPRGLT